jgi:beta-phosphoglucomutase-like phosphatase (HAD superfamily)
VASELIKPSGVVFDNDGLLLHTEPCWTLAQQEFFRSYGRTFDLADKKALVGTSPRTSAPILQRLLSGADSGERLSDQMYSLALTEIAAGASPRPGAVELVARLQSDGLPLAVASNAPRRHLLAGLQRVGLLDAFDVVLGVDDVRDPSPAPDLYLRLGAAAGGSGQAVAPCPTAVVSSQGQHRARAPRGVAVQHLRRVPLGLRRSPLASSCFATRCSIGTVPAAGGR